MWVLYIQVVEQSEAERQLEPVSRTTSAMGHTHKYVNKYKKLLIVKLNEYSTF